MPLIINRNDTHGFVEPRMNMELYGNIGFGSPNPPSSPPPPPSSLLSPVNLKNRIIVLELQKKRTLCSDAEIRSRSFVKNSEVCNAS